MKTRSCAFLLGGVAMLMTTASASPPTFLYSVTDDATYAGGCFGNPDDEFDCLCPIFLSEDFTGTFGVTVIPSGDPLFDAYEISDIAWTVGLSNDVAITGSGFYEVGRDADGALVHQLTLDLFFDGQGPTVFDSGLVPGGDTASPPEIAIPVSDGFFCPGRRLNITGAPSSAPSADIAPSGGDGAVNMLDLIAVLSEWNQLGPRPTDIDGSGQVGMGDLIAVLNQWET